MISPALKIELNLLNTELIRLHKGLLNYQTKRSEEQDGRKYNPYELLNMTFNDPRFQWFRKLSQLIARIDEMADSKNKKPGDPVEILEEAAALLDGKYEEFVGHYSLALVADPTITISEVDVRKAMSRIRHIINPKKPDGPKQ